MNISCDKLIISMNNNKSEAIREIALLPGIVQNLTEKWSYSANLPDSMDFDLIKDNKLIGQAAYKSIRWFNRKAELSLFIHPDSQGQKIGHIVLQSMIAHAFVQLNFHRLEAEVISYNKPALSLMKKLGFVQEGCLREARFYNGKYFDIFRYGLLKTELENRD